MCPSPPNNVLWLRSSYILNLQISFYQISDQEYTSTEYPDHYPDRVILKSNPSLNSGRSPISLNSPLRVIIQYCIWMFNQQSGHELAMKNLILLVTTNLPSACVKTTIHRVSSSPASASQAPVFLKPASLPKSLYPLGCENRLQGRHSDRKKQKPLNVNRSQGLNTQKACFTTV